MLWGSLRSGLNKLPCYYFFKGSWNMQEIVPETEKWSAHSPKPTTSKPFYSTLSLGCEVSLQVFNVMCWICLSPFLSKSAKGTQNKQILDLSVFF